MQEAQEGQDCPFGEHDRAAQDARSLRFYGLRSAERQPMRSDVRLGARGRYGQVLRCLESRSVRRKRRIQTAPRCTGHREKLCVMPHVEEVVHSAPAQPALARCVLTPPRSIHDALPAFEGPREVHQADVRRDAFVVTVWIEEIQWRDVVLLLALATDIEQVTVRCGRRPTRNVSPTRLPCARAILPCHRTASRRRLDRAYHRNSREPRRVQQVSSDVLFDC